MKIFIEVSLGEVLDKYSILKIKSKMIKDSRKLKEVEKEIESLNVVIDAGDYDAFLAELESVNKKLWDINDARKLMIQEGNFDSEYVELSKLESQINDDRFLIKQKINEHFGSNIKEQKSYGWLKE